MAATSPPSADALAAFVVFAEERNFTRAAQRLAISQPSLHAKIRKLAEQLDIELYTRQGKRLILTSAGQELASFARGHAARLDRFLDELRCGEVQRPVFLAAGEGAVLYLLGPALRSFARQRPGQLRLTIASGAASLTALRSGDADLAVVASPKAPPGFVCVRLVDSRPALAAHKDHTLVQGETVPVSVLAEHPLVLPDAEAPLRLALASKLARIGQTPKVAVEARGWPVALALVKHRIAPAIVNDIVKLPAGVVARPITGLESVTYWCVRRKGARGQLPAAVDDLLRAFERSARELD